jgi:hypothetical protein
VESSFFFIFYYCGPDYYLVNVVYFFILTYIGVATWDAYLVLFFSAVLFDLKLLLSSYCFLNWLLGFCTDLI